MKKFGYLEIVEVLDYPEVKQLSGQKGVILTDGSYYENDIVYGVLMYSIERVYMIKSNYLNSTGLFEDEANIY